MLFEALSRPTVRPLLSRLSTVYFTSDGVTVPSKKSGNTNTTMHATNAAHIRRFEFTAKIIMPEMPTMTNRPKTGIAASHIAEIRILK